LPCGRLPEGRECTGAYEFGSVVERAGRLVRALRTGDHRTLVLWKSWWNSWWRTPFPCRTGGP